MPARLNLLPSFTLVVAQLACAPCGADAPGLYEQAAPAQSAALLQRLQRALSQSNPDAVIEWCPLLLVAGDRHEADLDGRFGAACQLLDGVVPREALLCADPSRPHFAYRYAAEVTREDVVAFIEASCPADEEG